MFEKIILQTLEVVSLVFVMMVLVDLVNVWSHGKVRQFLHKGKRARQYFIASIFGALPGCMGSFTNVSLYIHGLISFGALTGAMAAASGDEAFVMLALFPKTAILLIAILFILGMTLGYVTDTLVIRLKIKTCVDCPNQQVHEHEHGFRHYLKEHVWKHIIKRHLWKTALWTFGALTVVELGMQSFDLKSISAEHSLALIFIAALIGLIPESGPHLIFVTMFAHGLIPFSVLFTSAFVQDGHGMLPMLSYSVKDSLLVKGFNIVFGLAIGLLIMLTGH